MCIERVSYNLFPCHLSCYSFSTTAVLIAALASAILAGGAFYLQWSALYIEGFAAGGGGAFVLATLLICCRKPSNLPSSLTRSERLQDIGDELFKLVQSRDLAGYKESLKLYPLKELQTLCQLNHTYFLQETKEEATIGYPLFQAILLSPSFPEKEEFLRATIESFEPHLPAEDHPSLAKTFVDQEIFLLLVGSNLPTQEKNQLLITLAQAIGNKLEDVKIDKKEGTFPLYGCSLMVLAILEEDGPLVALLAGCGALVNQPAFLSNGDPISPLMLALYLRNQPIAKTLLENGGDPNFIFTSESNEAFEALFPEKREECTQATPLMIAASLGWRELCIDCLKRGGVNFQLTDTGTPDGWTAQNYFK